MVNLDLAELRPYLDMEGKYVNFGFLRFALSVAQILEDLDISLSEPNKEGECRGQCLKCQKAKSFSLNINSNRFNCFSKGCGFKGGGVIDFFSKLHGVSAKEASHLLAYSYGFEPYAQNLARVQLEKKLVVNEKPTKNNQGREVSNPAPIAPQVAPPLTAQHLIASIEHQLAELKQLLTNR